MKQIVINADSETHAWIAKLAADEKRSMGNQVLALLGFIRSHAKPTKPRARKQTNLTHA